MTWEIFKAEPVPIETECPYCGKGKIKAMKTPSIKMEKMARGSAVNKRTTQYTKEKYQVKNDCPNCGASASKIEKSLNSGKDYKPPSRKRALERMRKSGLPTRI